MTSVLPGILYSSQGITVSLNGNEEVPLYIDFSPFTSLLNLHCDRNMGHPITSKLATVASIMDQYMLDQNHALEHQAENMAVRICHQNRLIAQLHSDIDQLVEELAEAQNQLNAFHRATRILYSADGRASLFGRNNDGVFVQLQTMDLMEEPPEEIARRLGFEADEDIDEEDEFTMRLYGFIN